MANPKPQTPQPQTPEKRQERDYFRTPNYATDMIAPYFAKHGLSVWECAAGDGRMARRLRSHGLETIETDIEPELFWRDYSVNFLTEERDSDAVCTNAPFSIKAQFIYRCMELSRPWALLLPAEWNRATREAVKAGARWLIPERRIDFITPNILDRIHEGEVYKAIGKPGKSLKDYKQQNEAAWLETLAQYPDLHVYESIDNAPPCLLAAYSASQFDSGWLAMGLGFENQINFCDLSLETKKTNI